MTVELFRPVAPCRHSAAERAAAALLEARVMHRPLTALPAGIAPDDEREAYAI
jgi:hypothetical protein